MTDSSIPPDTSIGAEDAEYIPPPASTGVTTNALLHSQAEPWTINAGASIAAMSANPTHTQVVVAGREVLRIFSTETLAETLNIRFGRINMLYSSNDVRWNPNESHNHLIATAATNGAVVIWNINMKGKKLERSMSDHTRTVNRITWQPKEPNNLLSGSQDGLMKLWDVRDPTKCMTFDAQSEVRDVQFSPFYSFYFASALENGNILIWDMRKQQPERRITAHTGLIGSLAWHPLEKNTLASGGRDRVIKTWDLTAGSRPSSTTQTIAFVGRLTWRPASHGRPWHIASSAGATDNGVHIWDTKKPFSPLATLQGSRDVTTSHIWTENNCMITSSKDGFIRFYDLVKHSYFPNKHMAATSIKFNVRNHVTIVHEPVDRKSNPLILEPLGQRPDSTHIAALFSAGPAFVAPDPETTPIARFADFIPSSHHLTRGRGALNASENGLLHGSPTFAGGSNASTQIPGALLPESDDRFGFDAAVFQHLAEHYVFINDTVPNLCEKNAQVAAQARRPQLVQMWRMLALVFSSAHDLLHTNVPHVHANAASNQAQNVKTSEESQNIAGGEKTTGNEKEDKAIQIVTTDFSNTNSEAAPSPAGGTRSVDQFSPNVHDDWDLHLLDVPTARGGSSSSNLGQVQAQKTETQRSMLSLDFGAFDHPSGFTDHDFVEDFDQPRLATAPMLEEDADGPHFMSHTRGLDSMFGQAFLAMHASDSLPEWEGSSIIHDILAYHEHMGDVQTCVYIGLVLQDAVTIEPRKMLAWMIAYVELLHRLQLWNCANGIAKYCHLDNIRNLSKQGTTIYTKCASCSKAILGNSGVYCENCKKPTSTCALCRLPVKGSLVWCPGCGHGGHSHHIRSWFEKNSQCPSGCGHICLTTQEPTPPSPSVSPMQRLTSPKP